MRYALHRPLSFCSLALSGLLLSGLLGACGEPTAPAPAASTQDPTDQLPLNRVWLLGSHNSYWAARQGGDPFAGGPGQPILEQLLGDGVRHLEFDLHQDPQPKVFAVYHAIPRDSVCTTLEECLGLLRTFQRTVPSHHPLVVMVEFKNLTSPLFDADHTIADLDQALTEGLGAALYRPADLLARCPGQQSLTACIQQAGWPTVGELRGRVLVTVMGYWHLLGGQNDLDWVQYATASAIHERAAFPLANMTEWAKLPTESQESVSPARFAQAIEQSLFLDGWDLKSAAIPTFLSQGKIVRLPGDDVATIQHGLQLGGQLFWSDLPWDIRRTLAPAQTLGLVGAMAGEVAPSDVGQRLQLWASSTDGERVFAYTYVDDEESIWESTVAMGVASDLRGCLLAAESPVEGSGAQISVCSSTTPNLIGLSSARTQVEVTGCAKTKDDCSRRVYLSRDGTLGGPGSVLRMEVSLRGQETCAVLRAARISRKDLSPIWSQLGEPLCVPGRLAYQGIARSGQDSTPSQVQFYQTSRNGQRITSAELSNLPSGSTAR